MKTPALVLGPPRYVGPLGVMRSLGRLGVPVYSLAHERPSISTVSRFCAGTVSVGQDGRPSGRPEEVLAQLLAAGRRLGAGTILIPGSDEWSVFVAAHRCALREIFVFPEVELEMVNGLADKESLYSLALKHGIPTPAVVVPKDALDAERIAPTLTYPVILKPVVSRPGAEAKAVVTGPQALLQRFHEMEEGATAPNLLCQEFIPGGDEDVWIFNGYFDRSSRCLAAFTGQKIRQHPAHMGIASLGILRQNLRVIELTERLMSAVGYQGIVDIGYRYDRRDGSYKVLDINPRLGGAFRLFVDRNGVDVVRAQYWDLTGEPVPALAVRDGRKWLHEVPDLLAYKHYRRLDGLSLGAWAASLMGVNEGAIWSATDPLPFGLVVWRLAEETLSARWARQRGGRSVVPPALAGARQ